MAADLLDHRLAAWVDAAYQHVHKFNTDAAMAGRLKFIYEQAPEIILMYEDTLQAYRTDRFTGYVQQPADGGAIVQQWGPVSYINVRPVSATQASAGGGTKIPTWVWIAAAVIALALVTVMVRRRGSASEDVE